MPPFMSALIPPVRRLGVAVATAGLAASLAACGAADDTATTASSAVSAATSAAGSAVGSATGTTLSVTDAWAKAVPELTGEMPMTGIFGTIHNPTGAEVTVTAGSSEAAKKVELHETVKNDAGQMVMQPKEGGFQVPAGGTLELKPGGNHIMLMGLTQPLKTGTTVTVTLQTSAGELVVQAPVRTFSGAQESYTAGMHS